MEERKENIFEQRKKSKPNNEDKEILKFFLPETRQQRIARWKKEAREDRKNLKQKSFLTDDYDG